MSRPGTVLVHPDHFLNDPDACRILAVVTVDQWPWRRVTGLVTDLPARGADLTDWQTQPLGDLGSVLGT